MQKEEPDMQLSSGAIRKQSFRKKFQGFDPAEVSAFLEEISGEFDRLEKENIALSQKAVELETQLKDFRSVEKALQQTLIQAQDSTAKNVEHSRKEAQLIIRDAEMKAARIVEKSRNALTVLREQITILGAKKESIVARLKMLLNSELDLVKALEVNENPAGAPPSEEDPKEEGKVTEIDDIVKSLDA